MTKKIDMFTKGIFVFLFRTIIINLFPFWNGKKFKGMCLRVPSSFYIGIFVVSKTMKGILNFLHLIIMFLIKKLRMPFPRASVCGSICVFWAMRAMLSNSQISCFVVSYEASSHTFSSCAVHDGNWWIICRQWSFFFVIELRELNWPGIECTKTTKDRLLLVRKHDIQQKRRYPQLRLLSLQFLSSRESTCLSSFLFIFQFQSLCFLLFIFIPYYFRKKINVFNLILKL